MEPFIIYLLKSSGVVALFLLFYMLFLRRETFFHTNRIYLLLGLVLALILPFIVLTRTVWVEPLPMFQEQVFNEIGATTPLEDAVDWVSLLLYGYYAGALFFTFRFVVQLFSLKKLIRNGRKIRDGKFTLVETDRKDSPFSFFNYLIYSPTLHTARELDTILTHEKIHARGLHSADMLAMHFFTIFQWCNPFVWLYRRYLDDNLEYLADTRTIAKNTDKADYQHLLLRTGIGENLYSVGTPFFNSSIKKRIIMLNRNRSHRKNSFKYAFILPLMAGFIFLFNVRTEAQVKSIDSIEGGTTEYGPVVYDKERSGDFHDLRITPGPTDDKLTVTKDMPSPFYIGDTFPLYIVDGKEISKAEAELIDPESIASINVWKGQRAIELYGQNAKNGVVVITLKGDYQNDSGTDNADSIKTAFSSPIIHDSIDGGPWLKGKAPGVKSNLGDENPLIVLNGIETSKDKFEKLKPDEIKSMNVLKGQNAIDTYGEKAKDGAIEVETKGLWTVGYGKMPPNPEKLNAFEGYRQMKRPGQPDIETALIFIDGAESSVNDTKSIKLDQIERTMTVQPDHEPTIRQYGEKARYGIIELFTKN